MYKATKLTLYGICSSSFLLQFIHSFVYLCTFLLVNILTCTCTLVLTYMSMNLQYLYLPTYWLIYLLTYCFYMFVFLKGWRLRKDYFLIKPTDSTKKDVRSVLSWVCLPTVFVHIAHSEFKSNWFFQSS